MKRTLLSIITITVFGLGANAQIIVNSTDLFEIGDSYEQAYDTVTAITIGAGGANFLGKHLGLQQTQWFNKRNVHEFLSSLKSMGTRKVSNWSDFECKNYSCFSLNELAEILFHTKIKRVPINNFGGMIGIGSGTCSISVFMDSK